MYTYSYSYQSDSKQEPVGRVMATSLFEAREKISIKKNLAIDLIDNLFVIKQEDDDHGKQIRKDLYF
jgi:hypothetical protein